MKPPGKFISQTDGVRKMAAGIIPFIIIAFVINIAIIVGSSSSSKDANRHLSEESAKLSSLGTALAGIQESIRRNLDEDPYDTGIRVNETARLIRDYEVKAKEYNLQLSSYRSARNSAYDALNSHRMTQNLFGGGANDLAALAYYRNENCFNKETANTSFFNEDTMLLFRAVQYVKKHEDKLRQTLIRTTDRTTDQLTNQVTVVRPLTAPVPAKTPAGNRKKSHRGLAAAGILGAAAAAVAAAVFLNWNTLSSAVMNKVRSTGAGQSVHAAEAADHEEISPAGNAVDETEAQFAAVSNVRLREGAGTDTEELAMIKKGETCLDLGEISEDGNWVKVSYQGMEGWVFKEYLEEASALALTLG